MPEGSVIPALTATAIAGLSTMLGIFPVFFKRLKTKYSLMLSLAFSAGIMLSVSFTELFSNGYDLLCGSLKKTPAALIATAAFGIGISFAAIISAFVPQSEDSTSRCGITSALCIGLHNFPEGIATFMAGYNNPTLGFYVALAIAMHNIPEGLSVALPIYCSSGSKLKAILYTFLSGITEPLGALVAFLLLRPIINNTVLGCILSLVAGIMIYIAIKELLPSVIKEENTSVYAAVFFGVFVMLLVKAI